MDIEKISKAVHQAYCKEYREQKRGEYWTGGDYDALNDNRKEFDRATVQAVLKCIDYDSLKAKAACFDDSLEALKETKTHSQNRVANQLFLLEVIDEVVTEAIAKAEQIK